HVPLLNLLRTCPGVVEVLPLGEAHSPFDLYAYMLSLPRLFGTRLDTIPAEVPYLFADENLVARWGEEFKSVSGYKIGIVWQGRPQNIRDRTRSVPLAAFEPLARQPGVHLFSLQVGHGREQLAALGERFPVTDLGSRFDPNSLDDAAAVVQNLDLV